jgi:hypothetical protein
MMELFRNNKTRILALLIFLLAVSVIYRVTHPYKQPKIDTLTYSGGETERADKKAGRKDPGASSVEESLLKLGMFLNPPEHSSAQIRDLFTEKAGMNNSGALSGETITDQESGDNTPAAGNESGVEDDLSSFRSFGYMERGGERILFIEKGKQIILVRKGDRIEGKYLVKEITKNELTLTVIPGNESVHIDLSGL